MREVLQNSKVRLVLALVIIVGIIGSLGGVYYMGQVNKSKALKGTKSKASTNTLTTSIDTACVLEFDIPTPTPTSIPPTSTPVPTSAPTATPIPVPVCIENADIALVIDRSGTMSSNKTDGKVNLEWAKDAAKTFIDTIKKSGKTNVRVSISSFGSESTIHSQLSTEYQKIQESISKIQTSSKYTCIQCGLRSANETLRSSQNTKYTILLSDGMANRVVSGNTNPNEAAIKEANESGVIYNTMGYGNRNSKGQINEDTLKKIIGSTGTYLYKPTADQWANGFLEILTKICTTTKSTTTPPTVAPSKVPTTPVSPTSTACVVPPPKDPPVTKCAPAEGTGQITWVWPAVPTAIEYEIDILDKNGKMITDNNWNAASVFNCASRNECSYTSLNLPIGTYQSSIRARSDNGCGPSITALSQKMEVKACPIPKAPNCASSPVDIVLALDRSGSMGTVKVNGKTKLEWEKQAAKAFIEVIEKQSDSAKKNIRVGVVDWAGINSKIKTHPVESSLTAAKNFISKISYERGDVYTCMECALNSAASLFKKSDRRRVVVFMSDGIGNRIISSCDKNNTCRSPEPPKCTNDELLATHCEQADTAAKRIAGIIKGEGIGIQVVGYGTQKPVRILENNLKAIASSNGTYHYGGDETNWEAVFANIAPQICAETITEAKSTIKKTVDRNRREGSRRDKEEGDD